MAGGVAHALCQLHGSLPALLRLVHRLDVPGLLVTLTKYMAGAEQGQGLRMGLVGRDDCCAGLCIMRAACSWRCTSLDQRSCEPTNEPGASAPLS